MPIPRAPVAMTETSTNERSTSKLGLELRPSGVESFTVVTFNVFTGTPERWIAGIGAPLACVKAAARSLRGTIQGDSKMRTMQTNKLESSQRILDQIEAIKQLRPDVLCLQEVFSASNLHAFKEGLKDDYDCYYDVRRRNNVGELVLMAYQLLWGIIVSAMFNFSTLAVAAGYLIANYLCRGTVAKGFLVGPTAGGLVTLWRKEKFVATSSECVEFRAQGGDFEDVCISAVCPRQFHQVELHTRAGGKRVWVLNTHAMLGVDTDCAAHCIKRRKQLSEMAIAASNLRKTGVVIAAGDFNAQNGGEGIEVFEDYGLTDAWTETNPGASGFTWLHANPLTFGWHIENERRLDYIWVGSQYPPGTRSFSNRVDSDESHRVTTNLIVDDVSSGIDSKTDYKLHPSTSITVDECGTIFDKATKTGVWLSDHTGVMAHCKIGLALDTIATPPVTPCASPTKQF